MIIVTAAQMQALDRRTITEAKVPGRMLMENAGKGVVAAMERLCGPLAGKSVAVLCGKGNNGGDGFVVARLLKHKRARPQVLLLSKATELAGDAKTMYGRLGRTTGKTTVHIRPTVEHLCAAVQGSDLIVDALLGTGLSAPVTGVYRSAIQVINDSRRPVIAVDLPSGLHADTGAVMGEAVRATMTVTFGLPKLGLYLGEGIDRAGTVEIADIGIPQAYVQAVESRCSLITSDEAGSVLPPRPLASHKGTYGHAGIIAGSVGKTGAAALAAKAALRTGAGLVTVAIPMSVNDVLEAKLLEAMTAPMPETKDRTLALTGLEDLVAFANARSTVAIGPGLSTHPETIELVRALVPRIQRPCVLDADALNAVSGRSRLLTEAKAPLVLTPHPGEMARLLEGVTTQSVSADRLGIASRFAQDHHVTLVLKGARTIVAHPDGRVAVCPTGNPGMATAGTGDVLTGMVVSLLAQGLSAWDAACAGTYLHGLAGDLAATALGPQGMTAGDLLERIPHALIQTA